MQPQMMPVQTLIVQLDAIHKQIRGYSYQWKKIDSDILEELLRNGFSSAELSARWQEAHKGGGLFYVRQLAAEMRKAKPPQNRAPAAKKRQPPAEANGVKVKCPHCEKPLTLIAHRAA